MPGLEDQAAAAVHVFGFVLAAILGARLLRASRRLALTVPQRRAVLVFIWAWLALYSASVAFHLAPAGTLRQLLMAFDQGAIFILVAAGWAPLAPFRMAPEQGGRLLVVLWFLAGLGIVLAMVAGFAERHVVLHRLGFALYLVQAAVPFVLYGRALWRRLSPASRVFIGGSMVIYGVGLIFYRMTGMPWNHEIWHLAIILGCVMNFRGFSGLLYEDVARNSSPTKTASFRSPAEPDSNEAAQ